MINEQHQSENDPLLSDLIAVIDDKAPDAVWDKFYRHHRFEEQGLW
jgi:hypothetical protein